MNETEYLIIVDKYIYTFFFITATSNNDRKVRLITSVQIRSALFQLELDPVTAASEIVLNWAQCRAGGVVPSSGRQSIVRNCFSAPPSLFLLNDFLGIASASIDQVNVLTAASVIHNNRPRQDRYKYMIYNVAFY